ncbi:MAG TPA: LysM peptidoglycan-binding domain-containing protein [Luteolibacter sp.]
MRWLRLFALLSLPLFSLLLPSCNTGTTSNPGRHPSGIGPFDRNGNYVEAWADTPSKWGKKSALSMASNSSPETDAPAVASNEEPPADAVPLPPAGTSMQTVKTTAPTRKSGEVEVASLSRPKPKVARDDDDDEKPKSTVKKSTSTKSKDSVAKNAKSKPTAKELAAAKAKAKSKATASASTKSKSKAIASTTAKKKPATRYTVKKGDNLVKIADRYNTTAAAIKKANGLKSAAVPPGKTLVIPKG